MAKPIPRRVSGSPGVKGAIKDAVKAVSEAVAPRSVTQRKARVNQSVDDATIGRMRRGQSTDSNNGM